MKNPDSKWSSGEMSIRGSLWGAISSKHDKRVLPVLLTFLPLLLTSLLK